jgi:hypothetical protein
VWRDRYEVKLVGNAWIIAAKENVMVACGGEQILDADHEQ